MFLLVDIILNVRWQRESASTRIKGANLRADNRGKASVSGESAGITGIEGDTKRSGFRNHQTQTSQSPNTNIAITENTNIAIASQQTRNRNRQLANRNRQLANSQPLATSKRISRAQVNKRKSKVSGSQSQISKSQSLASKSQSQANRKQQTIRNSTLTINQAQKSQSLNRNRQHRDEGKGGED